jgi:AcrR family transcriptional regulator
MMTSGQLRNDLFRSTLTERNDPVQCYRRAVDQNLSGRRREAARNDTAILVAAREVFLNDPKAPISAVADHAGVGISALYRRYASKEDLLRQLCHDGLRQFIQEAETAAGRPKPWPALVGFLERVVDADVHSLTVQLAGTFTSTPEMTADAIRSGQLVAALVDAAHNSGSLRRDITAHDIALILEGCAAVRLPDPQRTKQLRRRLLALMIAGLAGATPALPGPAPAADELDWRWRRSRAASQKPVKVAPTRSVPR